MRFFLFENFLFYIGFPILAQKILRSKQLIIKLMKYYNPLVDKEPVEIKILQYRNKDKDRVEITRDLNGKAGFWVNTKELINEFNNQKK